jgi:hypothetical protein
VLSEATAVGRWTCSLSFAGTSVAGPPSEALVFEEGTSSGFDIGIGLGGKEGDDKTVEVQDIPGCHRSTSVHKADDSV